MVSVRSPAASLDNRAGSAAPASPRLSASPPREPAAPPPPPPPPAGLGQSGAAAGEGAAGAGGRPGRHSARLRNFNWEAIPAERIRGRRSVWTGRGRRRGCSVDLDLQLLEELFGQRPRPPCGTPRGQPGGQVSLLDAKKLLKLGIFLKQFKRPAQEIVADIRDGAGAAYGAEKLVELTKMLPDAEEVKKLVEFQGNPSQLSEAEAFALLLVHVPGYARRLELLVLKEEFFPQLRSLQSAIQILTEAALELLDCEELHSIIRLVLKAGNHMNQGGYAGAALGFRMSSLLRLADTKANRPGMHLLHFVAWEAEKKDSALLNFPGKLQHVGPASRIGEREVLAELQGLGERLREARAELEAQAGPFLPAAEAGLSAATAARERLGQATAALCDFLCEEPEAFRLPECCGVFQAFGGRFLTAVQENRAREAAAHRQQWQDRERQETRKRRSIATCSSREPGTQPLGLGPLLLAATPRPGRHSRSSGAATPGTDSPRARERPVPLGRRHTLAVLSPRPTLEPPASTPEHSRGAPLPAREGLGALPVAPSAAPSLGPESPAGPSGLPVSSAGGPFPRGQRAPLPCKRPQDTSAPMAALHRLRETLPA